MVTVSGFFTSLLALGAVVTLIEVLLTVLVIAFCVHAALALIGVAVFSTIGIRHSMARRLRER